MTELPDRLTRRSVLKGAAGMSGLVAATPAIGTVAARPDGNRGNNVGFVHEDEFDPQGFFHITRKLPGTQPVSCDGGGAGKTLHRYRLDYQGDAELDTATLLTPNPNVATGEDKNYNWTRAARECTEGPYVRSPFVDVGPP